MKILTSMVVRGKVRSGDCPLNVYLKMRAP